MATLRKRWPLLLAALTVTSMLLLTLSACTPTAAARGSETSLAVIADKLALDKEAHQSVETAYFALGWFWGPDSQFGSIEGVIRTRVGYTGGTSADPTYGNIGDHSESIQVDFDPTVVSYGQLLTAFWRGHDATRASYSNQYRSVIFYVNDEQKRLAEKSRIAEQVKLGKPLLTSVEPYSRFYLAEDYHQKYYLRQRPDLVDALYKAYPDPADFRDSTAAARLNGKAGGFDTAYCPVPVP